MQPVTIFRHIACEGPGYLQTVLDRYRVPQCLVAIDRGDDIPDNLAQTSGVIIMGGPMSANDKKTWITREIHYIHAAIAAGLPVLGHCLGGQLIARALGARVVKNPATEIGWLPVYHPGSVSTENTGLPWLKYFEKPQYVFHWHGETFDIPENAKRLLSSEHCNNQAFLYRDNVLAFQCHIEMTAHMIDEWSKLYEAEISKPSTTIHNRHTMLADTPEYITQLNTLANAVYEYWVRQLT